MLAPRTLVTRATDTACATPAHEAEKGDSKGVRRVFSSRFFFAFCGNRDFLCILHSKRVSRLCSARRTHALRRLKADLLGKHPNKQSSLELASSALGARHSPRKDTDTQAPYGNPYQLCVPSKRYLNTPCLASGTKNIPFQLRSRARISSYGAACAQRTLLETFYRGTTLDTCVRLARCAHTCIQNISKSTFFF